MPAAAAAQVAPPPAPPDRPPPPVHALLSYDDELDEELLLDDELVPRSHVEDRLEVLSLRVDHESTSFSNPNASSHGYQLSRSNGFGFCSSSAK